MRQRFCISLAIAMLGSLGFATATTAHTSPEYFESAINEGAGVNIGHRHHITLVGTRNLGSIDNYLCVGALTDNDNLVNDQCAWLGPSQTLNTRYAGRYWYRGWTRALYGLAHRSREVF